jgi:RNA polymerase sigma factor (sigma-70 family)
MAQRSLIFFTRRTADPEIGRDLWAETWARAYANRDRFRGATVEEREGWVMGIGRKVLAGYYKTGAIHRRAMTRLELERPELDDADLERLERAAGLEALREQLALALGDVAAVHQEALRMRIVEGLPYQEIGRRLGIKEEAARARVSRTLRGLSDVLASQVADFELGAGE